MSPDAARSAAARQRRPVQRLGGPGLAGAWALHGTAGLALLLVAPWIVNGVTALQGRLARRMLR